MENILNNNIEIIDKFINENEDFYVAREINKQLRSILSFIVERKACKIYYNSSNKGININITTSENNEYKEFLTSSFELTNSLQEKEGGQFLQSYVAPFDTSFEFHKDTKKILLNIGYILSKLPGIMISGQVLQ